VVSEVYKARVHSGQLINVTFAGNRIVGRQDAFSPGAHADGFQFRSGPLDNVKIINNHVAHGTSANIFLEHIGSSPWTNVVVAGNLLMQDGSGLAGKQVHLAGVDGLVIECNTMVTLSSDGTGYTHGISIGSSTSVTVSNNVLYNSIYFVSTGYTSDYNLFYKDPNNSKALLGSFQTLAAYRSANPGAEPNSIEGDPQFVDIAGGDLSLGAASPGKDTGTACSTLITDLAGQSRPQGAGWDIGAYE
jgi:hypothetical protein